jgi:hypothetical protein
VLSLVVADVVAIAVDVRAVEVFVVEAVSLVVSDPVTVSLDVLSVEVSVVVVL